ncbi:hypothetical protein BDZ45DRAFT_742340 [Acephala macrosclerotiorum]|nr:hypothetical protein BDZ45DRAFT_742340 [Acephala macrosclerotiorum]
MENDKSSSNKRMKRKASPLFPGGHDDPSAATATGMTPSTTSLAVTPFSTPPAANTLAAAQPAADGASLPRMATTTNTNKIPRKKGAPRKLKFLNKEEWARLDQVSDGYTKDLSEDQIDQLVKEFVDENGVVKYDKNKLEKSLWDKKRKVEGKAAKPIAGKKDFEGEERAKSQPRRRGRPAAAAAAQAVAPVDFSPQDIANLLAQFDKYPAPQRPPWKTIVDSVGLPELAIQSWWFFEKERRKQAESRMNAGAIMGSGRPTMGAVSMMAPVPMFTPPPLPFAPTSLRMGPPLQVQPAAPTLPVLPQASATVQPAQIDSVITSPVAPPAAPGFDTSPIPPDVTGTNNGDGIDILSPEFQRMKLNLFEAIASISGSEDEGDN